MLGSRVKTFRDIGNEIYILLNDGTYIRLSGSECDAFRRGLFTDTVSDPDEDTKKMVALGILEFRNLEAEDTEIKVPYDLRLHEYSGEDPLYPAPVIVHLAIEWSCNLHCVYCSVRDEYSGRSDVLSEEDFKKILDKLDEWGVAHVSFTGGEPLLNLDLLAELLEYSVNEKGFTVNFSTNGTLIEEASAKKLADTGVENVLVSLDSHIPEINDMLRGRGTWKRILHSINLLRDYGMKLGIDCVVSRLNVSHLCDFARFLDNLNIPYLTFLKLKPGSMSPEVFRALTPEPRDYSNMLRKIGQIQNELSVAITLDCGSIPHLVHAFSPEELSNVPVLGCPLGFTQIVINPDGTMYPCAVLMDEEFMLGNAVTDDLSTLWNEHKTLRELRSINIPSCSGCEFFRICRGGCRGVPFGLGEGFYACDSTCPRCSKED